MNSTWIRYRDESLPRAPFVLEHVPTGVRVLAGRRVNPTARDVEYVARRIVAALLGVASDVGLTPPLARSGFVVA